MLSVHAALDCQAPAAGYARSDLRADGDSQRFPAGTDALHASTGYRACGSARNALPPRDGSFEAFPGRPI